MPHGGERIDELRALSILSTMLIAGAIVETQLESLLLYGPTNWEIEFSYL
jgi:hypothetical protein